MNVRTPVAITVANFGPASCWWFAQACVPADHPSLERAEAPAYAAAFAQIWTISPNRDLLFLESWTTGRRGAMLSSRWFFTTFER